MNRKLSENRRAIGVDCGRPLAGVFDVAPARLMSRNVGCGTFVERHGLSYGQTGFGARRIALDNGVLPSSPHFASSRSAVPTLSKWNIAHRPEAHLSLTASHCIAKKPRHSRSTVGAFLDLPIEAA